MKNKFSKKEIISFIGVLLITLGDYFNCSWIDKPYRNIIGFSMILVGTIILMIDVIKNIYNKKYDKKQITIMMILVLLGALSWNRMTVFYTSIVMVMHFLDKDLKQMIKYLFISSVAGLLLIIFLNVIGVIPQFVMHRYNGEEDIVRYGLGFRQPNVIYRFYVAMVMQGLISLRNNKWFMAIAILGGIVLFLFTNSRTGIVMLFLLIVLSLAPKLIRNKVSLGNKYIPYMFLAMTVISIITLIFMNDNYQINHLLSGRPSIWKLYFDNISFFGKSGRIDGLPLDNLFLYIMYCGGVYGFIFYSVLYFVSFKNARSDSSYYLFVIFFITFIYGFTENFTSQNESLSLIILLIQLFDKDKLKEIDDDYVYENNQN